MTEKRFYIDTIDGGGSVLTMNGVELGLHETCDLLNEQHETIQRLQQNINELLSVDIEEELLKENKQLKKVLNQLNDENKLMEKVLDNINEELARYRNEWVDL